MPQLKNSTAEEVAVKGFSSMQRGVLCYQRQLGIKLGAHQEHTTLQTGRRNISSILLGVYAHAPLCRAEHQDMLPALKLAAVRSSALLHAVPLLLKVAQTMVREIWCSSMA